MYKLIKIKSISGRECSNILRLTDNAFIPYDPNNVDYQRYLEWLAEGNEPIPADGEQA